MANTISRSTAESFYAAALVGLGWLEVVSPTGRRFGGEADARWKGFAGHLTLTDRIDVLVRDAAVTWGGAFAPARVFAWPGLAADEPFGPDWPVVSDDVARRLWREAQDATVASWTDVWTRAAAAWKVAARPDGVELPALTPATRVVVAGLGALARCVEELASRDDLSWGDQVVVVAGAPPLRHLAAIGGLLARKRAVTRIVDPNDESETRRPFEIIRHAGVSSIDHIIVSADADARDRDFARAAGDGPGAGGAV